MWGYNNEGQLGLGDNTPRNKPQLVKFFSKRPIAVISCEASYHTGALLGNNFVVNVSHGKKKVENFILGVIITTGNLV